MHALLRALSCVPLLASVAAQLPTCRLEGQVVDPMQQPVQGAVVVAEAGGAVLATTHADAEGFFVFGRLPCDLLTVRATTPGRQEPGIGAEWIDLLGVRRHFARIVTIPARAVTGVVHDEADRTVPHAWVVVAPVDCDRLALAASLVQADANGAFVLTHVPMGRCILRAWSPGHDAFEGTIEGSTDAVIPCKVETDAVQERIFVLEGASAAMAATARLEIGMHHGGLPLPLPPEVRRPRLHDGRWEIRGWPYADAMFARATVEGAALAQPGYVTPSDTGARTRPFTIDGEARVTGRIVGPDGPMATWFVVEKWLDPGWPVRVFGQTDAAGRFSVAAPTAVDDTFQFRVLGPGLVVDSRGPDERSWHQAKHAPGTSHTIGVHAARSIRLRAVHENGTPVAGATARLVAKQKTGRQVVWVRGEQQYFATGTTGLDGTLEIPGLDLDPGSELLCHVDSPAGFADREVTVGDELVLDLGAIPVEAGASVAVSCTDANRQPEPGARFALDLFPNGYRATTPLAADRQGRARILGIREEICNLRRFDDPDNTTDLDLAHGVEATIELRANR